MDRTGIQDPPKSIKHKYPNGGTKEGTVTKRVEQYTQRSGGADYLWVIEQIDWEDEQELAVRFGYYVRQSDEEKWSWGSQTTWNTGKSKTQNMIEEAKDAGIL